MSFLDDAGKGTMMPSWKFWLIVTPLCAALSSLNTAGSGNQAQFPHGGIQKTYTTKAEKQFFFISPDCSITLPATYKVSRIRVRNGDFKSFQQNILTECQGLTYGSQEKILLILSRTEYDTIHCESIHLDSSE